MIRAHIGDGVFNFRVVGVFVRDGKVLVHRGADDDFYALPGGRVEMFEETQTTLAREMKEELGADISVIRLLWLCEDFYEYEPNKVHEICLYYLASFDDPGQLPSSDPFWATELDGSGLEFSWLDLGQVGEAEIYPRFLREGLLDLPLDIRRVVENDMPGLESEP